MADTKNMTTGNPTRLIFFFALPLMLGNIFQQLYTVVDTAIVGQGVGMSALASLGTVDWLNWLVLSIASSYTQGFSVRISQKFGQQDMDGLKAVIGASAALSIVISALGVLVSQTFLRMFLALLQISDELYANAEIYARIIMGGFPAMMFYNLGASVLRAVGDSKTPLIAMIAASFTNIALDLVAVFVLDWGVAGAAGATVFSHCLAGTICACKIYKNPMLRFGRAHFRLARGLCTDLLRIGTPIAAKNVIISLGGIILQSVVNRFSTAFIAGFIATNKLYGLLEIAALSYGFAITTYVGQNYGAMQYQRIRKGVNAALLISIATSLVIAALMFLLGRPITMLFISTETPALAMIAGDTAYRYLCFMSAGLPALYLLYVYLFTLQGMGNTFAPLVSGIAETVFRVGVAILVSFTGFQDGLFTAEVSAWVVGGLVMMISYYCGLRKLPKTPDNQNTERISNGTN